MTLRFDLSNEQVSDLSYYLTSVVASSVRSCEHVPDVLFSIIGKLSVDVFSYYEDCKNKANEDSKESV